MKSRVALSLAQSLNSTITFVPHFISESRKLWGLTHIIDAPVMSCGQHTQIMEATIAHPRLAADETRLQHLVDSRPDGGWGDEDGGCGERES